MDIEIISEEIFGNESYRSLFEEIMSDVGKAFHMEKALLVLKPSIPIFITSIRLRTEPSNRTVADVANIRTEGDILHITITDERYAPDIMSGLWKRYGKESVNQQSRFDIEIKNALEKDIGPMVIASEEEYLKEMIGAIWRTMPEGIKNRHTFVDGQVITVVATEEILLPAILDEGLEYHKRMTEAGGNV
jgi:putative methanogenesis marker protein 17